MEKRFHAFLARVHEHMDPVTVEFEGKKFHQVGRNSSHDFFLACTEGELWVMSVGEGEDDEEGYPTEDRYLRQLSSWEELGGCYLGHF